MIQLEYWQAGVILAVFAYAIVYTTRKFFIKGIVEGYNSAVDTIADEQIGRALKWLEQTGVIEIEIDSDGEEIIVAGKQLK